MGKHNSWDVPYSKLRLAYFSLFKSVNVIWLTPLVLNPEYFWITTQIARFTWPTWGPHGSCRPQVGPMLAPWILLWGLVNIPWSPMAPASLRRQGISTKVSTISDHYADVIMTKMASQITSLTVVYSTVYSDADQIKHQRSASLAFVWGIHRDRWIPRTKGQLRGKCFHLMTSSCKWVLDLHVEAFQHPTPLQCR